MGFVSVSEGFCALEELRDGVEWRRGFYNTASGRADFVAECSGMAGFDEVMRVWGEVPLDEVVDPLPEPVSVPGEFEVMRADVDFLLMLMEG